MSNTYIYKGRVYADSFALSWAMNNKPGTGYECNNCIYFCSQYGVLTGYCANCQEYEYEDSRGTIEDVEQHTKESNTKVEFGDKDIFKWFQNLDPYHFEILVDVRHIFTDTWQEELPPHFADKLEIVESIMDWFEIYYQNQKNHFGESLSTETGDYGETLTLEDLSTDIPVYQSILNSLAC